MAILMDTGVFYALLDKGDVNHLAANIIGKRILYQLKR